MIERANMPRPRRWGRRALKAAVAVVAACVAADPGAISRTVGEVLVHAWEAAGTAIVDRELTALAGMLDGDRVDLRRAEALRDAMAVRLQALQVRRCAAGIERVPAGYTEDHAPGRPRTDPDVVDMDGAIVAVRSTIARADHYIDSARRLVRAREADLCTLRALADSQRARRQLAELDGVLPRWERRARFAAELLGSSRPAAESSSRAY
jgi:hypothetical protein